MESLQSHLNLIFKERRKANAKYSMRACASSLGLGVSTTSEILSGKRPITTKLRYRIGKALDMTEEQIQFFSAKPHGNSNRPLPTTPTDHQRLALDSFYVISQWFHYGILQLLRTKDFKNDTGWIADRLNITKQEAKEALARLTRIGLIEEDNGHLIDATQGHTTHLKDNFTNSQLKDFQIKALQMAMQKIESIPIQYRDNTSMTMAISKKAIPFAKKEITKFRRQLTQQLETFDDPDEVYQLTIGLCPLTQIKENNE